MSDSIKVEMAARCAATLKCAGTTLVLLGCIGLCAQLWAYWQDIEYHSSIGVISIVVGILFLRYGLRTAKYIRLLALVGLPLTLLYGAIAVFILPFDYLLISLHLTPGVWITGSLQGGFYIIFLFWLQNILGREEIAYTQVEHRITPSSTTRPLWSGVALSLGLALILYWALHSYYAKEAVDLARKNFGPDYKCFARSFY
jgi:hypothetical protein